MHKTCSVYRIVGYAVHGTTAQGNPCHLKIFHWHFEIKLENHLNREQISFFKYIIRFHVWIIIIQPPGTSRTNRNMHKCANSAKRCLKK